MKFHIDAASDIPNYLQLEHQIKTACLQRKLKPGDQLPSIRALAKELSIAIITIKRAYDDLQADGYSTYYKLTKSQKAELDKLLSK